MHHRCGILYVIPQSSPTDNTLRWLGTRAEDIPSELSGDNAYRILGVAETSTLDEIKSSFRKLAKETHPDLVVSQNDSTPSQRFVEILAAYEILSDPNRRAHYDQYLLTQRHSVQTHFTKAPSYQMYGAYAMTAKQIEVVEWLRWYRYAVKDIVSERRVVDGTSYFDVLQREFYSAIHAAYYGPEIISMNLLPDRFEAEERSVYENPEVLHLVAGRDLFGIVCIVSRTPELSNITFKKLTSANVDVNQGLLADKVNMESDSSVEEIEQMSQMRPEDIECHTSDAYKNLELRVCGRLVAIATRVPPKSFSFGIRNEDSQDQIHIFLSTHGHSMHIDENCSKHATSRGSVSDIPIGVIAGLGTNPDESFCNVYNCSGTKTHVILKHRTPLVKHMHWFQLGDEVSVCECRCTRAYLPPSKYWLFEPRCSMHDRGGWYVETYGRDAKSQTVLSQRYWDGIDAHQQFEKRLHPAVYLLALAYRTLDIEKASRRKRTMRNIIDGNLFKIFKWCKKLLQ